MSPFPLPAQWDKNFATLVMSRIFPPNSYVEGYLPGRDRTLAYLILPPISFERVKPKDGSFFFFFFFLMPSSDTHMIEALSWVWGHWKSWGTVTLPQTIKWSFHVVWSMSRSPGIYLLTWTKTTGAESAWWKYFGTLQTTKDLKHPGEGWDSKFW